MAKKKEKFDLKKLLTTQNVIILILCFIIILMFIPDKKEKNIKEEKFELNFIPEEDYTFCQRLYHTEGRNLYSVVTCNGEVYASKDNSEEVKLKVENVVYAYSFLFNGESLIYLLTKNGEVYYLSNESLLSELYTLEKLDLKNITSINNFYLGKSKEDAFSNRIYAVDKDGTLHEIKNNN